MERKVKKMDREIDLKEISDGRFYGINDMVKADCQGCHGCSSCCRGMGTSILLDPLDVFRLSNHLGCSFDALLEKHLQLQVVDGVILPNLRMTEEEDACTFLGKDGRCAIHAYRPGLCRLFPLGRCYENGSFRYFLQTKECPRENKSKVKVKKWMDTPDVKRYEEYIADWHYFLKDLQKMLEDTHQESLRKKVCMYVLRHFFMEEYHAQEDFYDQFYRRLKEAKPYLGFAG